MLELLGTVVSSVLGGGATGLLGVIAQRYADFQNRKLDIELRKADHEHEIAMREADSKIVAQEWAGRVHVADADADARVAESDGQVMIASYGLEPKQYSAGQRMTKNQAWLALALDVFRGAVRPGLVVYLCYMTSLIYIESKRLGSVLTADQSFEMYKLIIGTILYLFTTTVLWWYGTRNKGAAPK